MDDEKRMKMLRSLWLSARRHERNAGKEALDWKSRRKVKSAKVRGYQVMDILSRLTGRTIPELGGIFDRTGTFAEWLEEVGFVK